MPRLGIIYCKLSIEQESDIARIQNLRLHPAAAYPRRLKGEQCRDSSGSFMFSNNLLIRPSKNKLQQEANTDF